MQVGQYCERILQMKIQCFPRKWFEKIKGMVLSADMSF